MGPKARKGPKARPKNTENTAAKETVPLRKSPRLARSEGSDRSDHMLNTTLSTYSGSTEIIPPTAEASSPTPILHLQLDENPDQNQIPTASPRGSPGGNGGGNGGGNNSDMESLTARIQQLETEMRNRPVGAAYREEETNFNRAAMPTTSRESGGIRRRIRPKRRRGLSSSSSSSSEDNDDEDDDDTRNVTMMNPVTEKFVYTKPPKTAKMIPPFTGEKELWVVWYERFKAITAHWTHNEKLSAMLALVQGTAGEYVYDILPAKVRKNYNLLVTEMTSRFKKIISLTSYRNKYSKIKQKSTQSLEELAAVIRKTYEKAYPDRAPQTKREDLLRKFLDSLYDPKTKLALEFFKEPESIEEALEKAIAYEDAKGESPPKAKVRRVDVEGMSTEDIFEAVLADEQETVKNEPDRTKNREGNNQTNDTLKKLEAQMTTLLKQNEEKQTQGSSKPQRIRQGNVQQQQTKVSPPTTDNKLICWNCTRVGHISRNCLQDPRQCYTCQRWGHIQRFCPSTNGTERSSQNPFSANQSSGSPNRPQNYYGRNPQRPNRGVDPVPPLMGQGGQAVTRGTTN